MTVNLDEPVRLFTTNSERDSIELFSNLYGLIVSLEYLERAYVRDSVSSQE
jgi:ESCRT-I complex subunit VPS28